MAPPLVKGRALLRRRIAGVVFLIVIGLLVELTIALYDKRFTSVVHVALETNRVGNQLSNHADVKVRGVIVGEVRKVRSNGDGATLELALKPERITLIPRDVQARLLPKTLFGEKEVSLVVPAGASREHLRDGDRITQDRSTTALETETALNDLLPVLRSLRPQDLALTLNALSEALRDRGDRFGSNLAQNAAYFRRLNPALPTLAADMAGLADLTNTYSDATPDLLRTLDNLSFSSRSLIQQRTALETFLESTKDFAASADSLLRQNEQRFDDLAAKSKPSLQLYARYSPGFPCMLNRIAFSEIEGERVFGGLQPGLHITVEVIQDNGPFVAGDEPKYKETVGPTCFGLGKKPIIPMPAYRNPQDGYRDSDPPEDPGTGPGSARAAWFPTVQAPARAQQPVTTHRLPAGTTALAALLIGPLTGNGA